MLMPRQSRRFTFGLILLVAACSQPASPAARPVQAPESTPTQVATANPVPGAQPPGSGSSTTGPVPATPSTGSARPAFEISELDAQSTISYPVTSRFMLVLDEQAHPRAELRVACTPDGVLGPISNVPPVAAPRYAVRYEGLLPGTCTVTDRDFVVTVRITG
jgi:hypothetical protein